MHSCSEPKEIITDNNRSRLSRKERALGLEAMLGIDFMAGGSFLFHATEGWTLPASSSLSTSPFS